MALETATYISDLNASNPASGDAKSQGDDHLRLIKSAVKNTFPNVSGAVTATHTELNYVDGVTSAIQSQLDQSKLVNGTAQATTSGTSVEFTSIPSWAKRITISFSGLSTNGTAIPMIQLGDSGGYEATGYNGTVAQMATTPTVNIAAHSTGFLLNSANLSTSVYHGAAVLTLLDASTNTWSFSVSLGRTDLTSVYTSGAGTKALSATLDRLRLIASNGTDAFDAGLMNIQYD